MARNLDNQQLNQVIRSVVNETLQALGFNLQDLHQTQADLHFLRRFRLWQQEIFRLGWQSFIAVIVPALLLALWIGIKGKLA